MKFILFKRTGGGFKQVSAAWMLLAVLPVSAFGVLIGGSLMHALAPTVQSVAISPQDSQYEQQLLSLAESFVPRFQSAEEDIAATKAEAAVQLRVMAGRVAAVQARLARIEAVTKQLADEQPELAAVLTFDKQQAVGGPNAAVAEEDVAIVDVLHKLELLEGRLENRERQLNVIENLVVGDDVAARLSPSGRPIIEGWLSSPFGKRIDPFTDRVTWHKGIDFAGREGAEIIAVADGVVSFSGRKSGYGLLVEIQHGNGVATRYGHNRENIVSVGDEVVAGEVIARIGSTGRSTGPHVHFELLENGRKVNPKRVIAQSR